MIYCLEVAGVQKGTIILVPPSLPYPALVLTTASSKMSLVLAGLAAAVFLSAADMEKLGKATAQLNCAQQGQILERYWQGTSTMTAVFSYKEFGSTLWCYLGLREYWQISSEKTKGVCV